MANGGNGGDAHALARHIEAIEGLLAEQKQTGEHIKARYKQAAAEGIDERALKALVRERRSDLEKAAEIRVAVDRMRNALGGLAGTELGEWATAVAAAQTTASKRRTPKVALPEAIA